MMRRGRQRRVTQAWEDTPAIVARLRDSLKEQDLDELVGLDDAERRKRLTNIVEDLARKEAAELPEPRQDDVVQQVVDATLGLGILEPLLADPDITEIMVNGLEPVYVEIDGMIPPPLDVAFRSEADLYLAIERIVSKVNRRIDESSPMVDARLPPRADDPESRGDRVNVIIPPLVLTGATITIRKFPKRYDFQTLIDKGTLDAHIGELLKAFVKARLNIVISGGTGAGKTTLLNALSAAIPRDERVITIEDSAELSLDQPHVVSLEYRPPNVEGRGEVTIRDLVRNSLRMRPDRIIVGEVRGAETLDMLQAMNTGHAGSIVTVHANSPDDALPRLETLAAMSDVRMPPDAVRSQITRAIHVVVQIERFTSGNRRITEIAELVSHHGAGYETTPIARIKRSHDASEHPPNDASRQPPNDAAERPPDDAPENFDHFRLSTRLANELSRHKVDVPYRFGKEALPPHDGARS